MENKALTQAKDAVAERHGYGNMETLLNENWTDEDIVNEVAIEYNRIMSDWVDVKERLPEYNQKVLIYRAENDFVNESIDTIVFGCVSGGFPSGVIKWMPLPPAPQK